MLYWLLYPLHEDISFFRIFSYTTFRMVFAAVTALVISYMIGPAFIRYLKKLKFGEEVREDGPESHRAKAGTPTMGGLMIIVSTLITVLLWGYLSNTYVLLVTGCTVLLAMIGFRDDYQKSIMKVPGGMRPRVKLFLQVLVGASFATMVYLYPYNPDSSTTQATELFLPFLKDSVIDMGLGAIFFWVIVITGSSNAVNLTDGLDGLAAGISAIVISTLGILAYVTGVFPIADYLLIPFVPEANEISVVLAALTGSIVGFLWFNSYPAQVFMGDTGSLAIGGAVGMSAILIKREITLVILGGIFVAEALSVILQVGSYKLRGKRIFKMAPLHHHFELKGWHENKVVTRFWIMQILLALLSLSTLKIL